MFGGRSVCVACFLLEATTALNQVALAQDSATRIDIGYTFVGAYTRATFSTTVVLSGRGHINEASHGRNTCQVEALQFAQDLGGARWQVMGSNRLQRTINYENHSQILQVTVSGRSCTTSVTTRLKLGKTTYILRNLGDGRPYVDQKPRYENLTCA
jgi:hypothetical protein